MLVKISSQISPNSIRFGVNVKLNAKDTRRVNNLVKNNVIYSSPRNVIIKNKDTSKETGYLCLKQVNEKLIDLEKETKETVTEE